MRDNIKACLLSPLQIRVHRILMESWAFKAETAQTTRSNTRKETKRGSALSVDEEPVKGQYVYIFLCAFL